MKGIRRTITSALVLGLACHAVDAHAQACQKDNDCPGDLVCNSGQCQSLSGAAPPTAASPTAATPTATSALTALSGAMAAAPAAGAVTVQFIGDPVSLADKASGQVCQVPCSMQLTPGTHQLEADGQFPWEINVGSQGGTFRASKGDMGMIVGGAMATAFGIAGVIVGGVFTIVGSSSSDDTSSSYSEEDSSSDLGAVGKPILIAGGGLLVVGIVLLASAEKPGVTQTANTRAAGVPMVGVAPTQGGAMLGATMNF